MKYPGDLVSRSIKPAEPEQPDKPDKLKEPDQPDEPNDQMRVIQLGQQRPSGFFHFCYRRDRPDKQNI